jgi:hypothetical protein
MAVRRGGGNKRAAKPPIRISAIYLLPRARGFIVIRAIGQQPKQISCPGRRLRRGGLCEIAASLAPSQVASPHDNEKQCR